MATLLSKTNGNFTSAATWAVCDSGSELDSESNTQNTTTTPTGATFVPGAITIDALAIKLSSRTASPVGTLTIDLYNATSASVVSGTAVTVNVSDLPQRGGWVVFPCPSAPITLLAATNYQIRVSTSASGEVTLFRNATSNNWSRQLRTTSTAAPVAGDKLIVAGEHTGTGFGNNIAVTMDETATTLYGSLSFPQSLHISKRGTLQYGTSAATAYHLRIKGHAHIREGGTLTMGTVGTPVPSTSSAILEFDATAAADSGLTVNGGTFVAQGNALTYDRTTLAADAAAAATSMTTAVSTGWVSGDELIIFPTKRTHTEGERRAMSGNAAGTSVPVPALTYAHDGTGVYAGEVGNLTRNVKIQGISVTNTGFFYTLNEAQVDCDWAEFRHLGHASTATRRGIVLNHVTGGSVDLNRCSMHTFLAGASLTLSSEQAAVDNINVNSCIISANSAGVYIPQQSSLTSASILINDCLIHSSSSYGALLYNNFADFTNNIVSGNTAGLYLNVLTTNVIFRLPNISGNYFHSGGSGSGIQVINSANGTLTDNVIRRWATSGLSLTSCYNVNVDGHIFDSCTTYNVILTDCSRCTLNDLTINSSSGFASNYGVGINGIQDRVILSNVQCGTTFGHALGDVVFVTNTVGSISFQNATFGSSIELVSASTNDQGIQYSVQRYNGVAGSHRIVRREGTQRRDTSIVNAATASVRLTPSRTYLKLRGSPITAAVQSGQVASISIDVRKSVVGDGTAYTGSQPRLIVLANPSAGILTDTVLDTAAAAAGTWETLSGSTVAVTEDCVLEFVVDCDGTAGWINYENPNTTSFDVYGDAWRDGAPWMTGVYSDTSNFTDVPTDRVELGYAYKYNSPTNNRTGTRRQPATGEVKTGILYGPSDSLTGTYDGSDRWTDPGVANVRSGISYKANSLTNNRTGDVVEPTIATVKIGTTYGTLSSLTGTYDGSDRWTDPGESVVLEGIAYKANSTINNKLGTLDLSSVATATAAAVWNTNLTSYTTANTAGLLVKTILLQITNLISLSWIRRR